MKSMRLRIIGFGVIIDGKPNNLVFHFSPGAKRSVEKD